jgi:hypothetical protein
MQLDYSLMAALSRAKTRCEGKLGARADQFAVILVFPLRSSELAFWNRKAASARLAARTEPREKMRRRLSALICTFLPLLLGSMSASAETYLLSISGLSLTDDQYIDRFNIQTWGVQIVAVCHIPVAWRITAGKFLDPEGTLSGETEAGMAFIRKSELKKLESLFLVEFDQYQPYPRGNPKGEFHPATFAGKISRGTFGPNESDAQEIELKPENFARTPASACPAPAAH